jgi:hypothetical protein
MGRDYGGEYYAIFHFAVKGRAVKHHVTHHNVRIEERMIGSLFRGIGAAPQKN